MNAQRLSELKEQMSTTEAWSVEDVITPQELRELVERIDELLGALLFIQRSASIALKRKPQ